MKKIEFDKNVTNSYFLKKIKYSVVVHNSSLTLKNVLKLNQLFFTTIYERKRGGNV